MESNPIQQRIEELEMKYVELRYTQTYKYLILRTPQDEREMVEAFYDHMLGIENEIEDVVLVFQSPLYEKKTYSMALIEELFSFVFLWNFSEKPSCITDNYVDWEMDRSLESEKNVAALFVANLNAFCEAVELEEHANIVCVLDYQNREGKLMLHWLKDLAQLELHPRVNLFLADTFEQPLFNALKDYAPKSTQILVHQFELDQAIKELAAMGDPEAPDTKFRYHMVQLFEAINKKREKDIEKHAAICMQVAEQNKTADANWYVQQMVIYSALSTFEFGKKQFKQAVNYINQGLDILQEIREVLPDDLVYRLLGQGLLFRGNLYLFLKQYEEAKDDFIKGETYFENCLDYLMQIEALRSIAETAKKIGDKKLRYEALNKGVRLGGNLNDTLAQSSSYALLVKDVLDAKYNSFVSDKELDTIIKPLLGEQWRTKYKSVKSILVNKEIK
ncbi:MAG: hypothetical protein LBI32_06225 [Myroides odoratus]|jgi:tetratricopeptide (TPR) repeat protein|nr:hypothetical protein [Myroides odoratus]